MTSPSTTKALLLAAAIAAAHVPLSRGDAPAAASSAAASSSSSSYVVVLDAKSGDGIDIGDGSRIASLGGPFGGLAVDVDPVEFLQHNPPELVLASTFPTMELHAAFESWKIEFDRSYGDSSPREAALRKLIWLENHSHIETHNNNSNNNNNNEKRRKLSSSSSSSSYELGHNDFSDMTNDEFRRRFYLGEYSPGVMKPRGRSDGSSSSSSWLFATTSPARKLLRNASEGGDGGDGEANAIAEEDEATVVVADVPEKKDWKEDGAVSGVKNQWFCGACWAFSAVGAIEGARYINTGNLTELSVQQLIDCDMTDLGCGGGLMDQAFQYDEDAVGLCPLEEYPFAYHRHWIYGCKRYMPYCDPLPDTKVAKFVDVEKTEDALRAAIATQPVSVAVTAGPIDWQFYKRGIFDKGCDADIDHGVLAVGYGHYDPSADDPGVKASDGVAGDYWLIKNSWGESWGLNGYIQLARGVGNEAEGGSSCVLTLASRPIMKAED